MPLQPKRLPVFSLLGQKERGRIARRKLNKLLSLWRN